MNDITTAAGAGRTEQGLRISAVDLAVTHPNGIRALDGVSLEISPGRLTAVIGPSGAGKSTLLAALGGLTPAQRGTVTYRTAAAGGAGDRDTRVGFVPQDDILHTDLPLRRTLRHAAALRMAAPRAAVDAAVTDALRILGLTDHGDVPVRALSGGQRKRASIACEILTRPGVCFLDEPTSGLDPAAAADIVAYLRRMCGDGGTVVFTTHNIDDVLSSDHVIVLGRGGRLAASGTPDQVLEQLGSRTFVEIYDRLSTEVPADVPTDVRVATVDAAEPVKSGAAAPPRRPKPSTRRPTRPGVGRQWWVLTRRALELLVANRLTLAIVVGSPAAVIAMFGTLFRSGTWSGRSVDPTAAVQVAYWLAFAGFFFGLTFGLLQVVTEVQVLRRERHAGVRTVAYLASKVALLTPVLLLVNLAMLAVLRLLDRLPDLSTAAMAELYLTMDLNAVAALCLGLLASALVHSPAQAALALPMLCFPAVLFAGAVVPLPVMTEAGQFIAALLPDRWAFEAIAGRLGTGAPPGSPQAGLGASSAVVYWSLLLVFTAALAAGAYGAVVRRAGRTRG